MDSPSFPRDTRVKFTLIPRPLLTPVAVYSRAERVFILEHYIASKSFAAVREHFSNAYSYTEVWNKTTTHRLVTKFRDTGNACL
jgi:hypothetical protein